MIIIEGPDGAGKTTLINLLSKDLDIPVAPRVVTKDMEAMVDLQEWVEDFLSLGKDRDTCLYDRHRLISEPIYGSLHGRVESGFDKPQKLEEWWSRFCDMAPLVIFCIPPYLEMRANIMADPDNLVIQDEWLIGQLHKEYEDMCQIFRHHGSVPTEVYDYTAGPREYSKVLSACQDYLHLRKTVG